MKPWLAAVLLILLPGLVLADVQQTFEKIKNDPVALYAFLKEMPKGGELHFHFAGGAYPESILALTAKEDYCLEPSSLTMIRGNKECKGYKSSDLTSQPELYEQTVRAWSMKDFIAGKESGHDHFFSTFPKFITATGDFQVPLLADIMKIAASQNELYMEIMLTPKSVETSESFHFVPIPAHYKRMADQLKADSAFMKEVQTTAKSAESLMPQVMKFLKCPENPEQPVCQLTVRFQLHVLREQPLERIFIDAYHIFAAANRSNAIVGVNIVQAEDGIIALRDYHQQMEIFGFMHSLFPNVHISMHAGELAPQTSPEALRFHIRDAILTAHAERIGHGVDIAFEDKSEDTLKTMSHVPVEINLISNAVILNVSGKEHPLRFYLDHQVPVVLSTDDEGILRTDLTRQYVEAVLQHGLDYPTLKQINRNAIIYSFLPKEEKQRLLKILDEKLTVFERSK